MIRKWRIQTETPTLLTGFLAHSYVSVDGPDSSMVRASALGVVGYGFAPYQRHLLVPLATLCGTQHYNASIGFSLPKLAFLTLHVKTKASMNKSDNNSWLYSLKDRMKD